MENFTPVASLFGGTLIGLSVSALLLFNGKIAGISGIVAGLLSPTKSDIVWRAAFVAGLLTGGFILQLVSPEAFAINIARSGVTFALAGLLIGFGARLGNGCTSGHGVCGVSRFSVRSIIASATAIVNMPPTTASVECVPEWSPTISPRVVMTPDVSPKCMPVLIPFVMML